MPSLTVAELAALCEAQFEGEAQRVISGANTLEGAGDRDLAFCDSTKVFEAAARSKAGCLVVSAAFDRSGPWSLLRVANPRAAFAGALLVLYPPPVAQAGIHPTALIDGSANIADGVSIGAYVTVGAGSSISAGCTVGAGCHLGRDVHVGASTTLHPNVTLYNGVSVGARVIIHAGCVIGADGFGYIFAGDRYEKFPQVGTVEIADDVELGANTCVDRAALGVTRIGAGSKLDNLVHVAHNCVLGRHVVVAAQTGFSGSVSVGDYAVIGGQAGIGEKARIDSQAIVGGKAGVLTGQHIVKGEPVWGIPARPLRQHLRNLAHVSKLPQTHKELHRLSERVDRLEKSQREDAG
jgi:UDP-3-O-[3-hydroxymyristoyl] glucosamine N-acyltransferase